MVKGRVRGHAPALLLLRRCLTYPRYWTKWTTIHHATTRIFLILCDIEVFPFADRRVSLDAQGEVQIDIVTKCV